MAQFRVEFRGASRAIVLALVMQTSVLLLRQVRRALAAAFLLGGFAALLQLALPLCALHAIDTAIPARSTETLLLLVILAVVALAALAALSAARARMLLRAGLWLDHTLGCHLLESGLRHNAHPETMARDAAAIARIRAGLCNGTVLALLDLPWLLVLAAGFVLLDWRLALIGIAAASLILVRLLIARQTSGSAARRVDAAARRVEAWWNTTTRMTGLGRLPSNAAEQWERLNREHVAGAYELGSRLAAFGDFARFVRTLAQVAALALGGWLAMTGEVTTGLLVAAILLLWRMLEPAETALAGLGDIVAVREAWAHLAQMAVRAAPASRAGDGADLQGTLPRLRLAGPLAAGLAAVVLVFAVGAGIAAFTSVGQIAVLAGAPIFETRITTVFPARAGIGGQVLVAEGARVDKGDVLVTLDTKPLDARIATLKLQAATAQIEMRTLNEDVAALIAPGAPQLRNRTPLAKLEGRIGEIGRQSLDLKARIAVAEEDLARSLIVSPTRGRVVRISARPGMPLETDAPLATIVSVDTTLLARLLEPFSAAALHQAFALKHAPPLVVADVGFKK